MDGYRFYADLPGTATPDENGDYVTDKPLLPLRTTIRELATYADNGKHLNCIALFTDAVHRNTLDGTTECLAAIFAYADSDTAVTGVSREHLRKCRRIPESLARKLHPRLFAKLDEAEAQS